MANSEESNLEGRCQISHNWEITLPGQFKHRIEDGASLFMRPGFMIWADFNTNAEMISIEERLYFEREDVDPDAFDITTTRRDGLGILSYRLIDSPEQACPDLYAVAISAGGDLLLFMNFSDEREFPVAQEIVRSVQWNVTVDK